MSTRGFVCCISPLDNECVAEARDILLVRIDSKGSCFGVVIKSMSSFLHLSCVMPNTIIPRNSIPKRLARTMYI